MEEGKEEKKKKKKKTKKKKKEKEEEEELIDKLSDVALKPVPDLAPSKEPLHVTSSTPDVSSSADAVDSQVFAFIGARGHQELTPLESMELDLGDEPKKGDVDAMEATSSAEVELAQPLPRSRSRIDLLPGSKSAFALLDGPLPDKEVLMDSKPSDALTPLMRKKLPPVIAHLFDLVWPDLHPDLDQRLEVGMPLDRGRVRLVSAASKMKRCNLHLCLHMYCPSWKYCIAHPRAFAACVLSSDEALDDAWCCWACYVPTTWKEGARLRTVWPSLDFFLYH